MLLGIAQRGKPALFEADLLRQVRASLDLFIGDVAVIDLFVVLLELIAQRINALLGSVDPLSKRHRRALSNKR